MNVYLGFIWIIMRETKTLYIITYVVIDGGKRLALWLTDMMGN